MPRGKSLKLINRVRCTRSCFQCPICVAPLSVSSIEPPPDGLGAEHAQQTGPFVLNCSYCMWSSKEIGILFDKASSIFTQLSKINNGGQPRKDRTTRRRDFSGATIMEEEETVDTSEKLDAESQFANLKSFYQSQLTDTTPGGGLGFTGDYGYGSPGALSRIMGIYTGATTSDKKAQSKSNAMRDAHDTSEGLQIVSPSTDTSMITTLRTEGFASTTTMTQRTTPQNTNAHFISDLRPIPYLLRTKRSKRCKVCRHILAKPEAALKSTRFRIRLVAKNCIPSITITSLSPSTSSLLAPLKPIQFVLTFKNPLFDSVKVTLATPAKTPGRFASKVTVLCPQFDVGANVDAWEEALKEDKAGSSSSANRFSNGEKRRTKAEASEGQNQAEAGKVWERGRNWVSVVVEIVPANLKMDGPEYLKTEEQKADDGPLREDEDICEIPVFVRVEWEADANVEEGPGAALKEKEVKEKRELAYWCVLGVGKIANT